MNERPRSTSAVMKPALARVVLVEDDEELRSLLLADLVARGFQVVGLPSAERLYRHLAVQSCDVVVLDIGLPGEDGYSVTAHLRQLSTVGIILLTARGGPAEMRRGLKHGADLFLTKPVDYDALASSISNLHARLMRPAVADSAIEAKTPMTWSLTADGWTLRGPQGLQLQLLEAERAFLQPLFARAGQAVPREELIAALTNEPWDYDPHRLEVLLHRLRSRVRARFDCALPVRAIRGAGYLLASE